MLFFTSCMFIFTATMTSSLTSHSEINIWPPNIVVTVSQPATFYLTYATCNWDRVLNRDLIAIYRPAENVSVNSRYSLNQTLPGQCDLTIKNVSFSDAGIYQYGNGDAHGFEVFVIELKPVCFVEPDEIDTSDSEAKNVTLKLGCSLSYSNKDKKLFPILKWLLMLTADDTALHSGEENIDQNTDHSKSISVVRVPFGTPVSQVVCFAQLFGIPTSSSDDNISQNKITFDSHCEIDQIEIPARNIKITGTANTGLKEKLICSAEGFPAVNYYWTKDDIRVAENPVLVLEAEGLHVYKCSAYNVIGGHKYTVSVEKTILIKQNKNEIAIAALVFSIFDFVEIIVIMIIIFFVYAVRRQNESKMESDDCRKNIRTAIPLPNPLPMRQSTRHSRTHSTSNSDEEYAQTTSRLSLMKSPSKTVCFKPTTPENHTNNDTGNEYNDGPRLTKEIHHPKIHHPEEQLTGQADAAENQETIEGNDDTNESIDGERVVVLGLLQHIENEISSTPWKI